MSKTLWKPHDAIEVRKDGTVKYAVLEKNGPISIIPYFNELDAK